MASNGWASALILSVALAGCGDGQQREVPKDAGLEQAALQRGLIRRAGDTNLTGLFVHETDRICIVEQVGTMRIGVRSEDGEGLRCTATGVTRQRRDTLDISLGSSGDCQFDARYEGDRIRFPTQMPEGCARFCSGNASLAALRVERVSDSVAEAGALRDFNDRILCPIDD